MHDELDRVGATDLLVFSHGWNNTPAIATRLYEAFFTRVRSLLALHGRSGRTVAYLGVSWPSSRWAGGPIPPFGRWGGGRGGVGAGCGLGRCSRCR